MIFQALFVLAVATPSFLVADPIHTGGVLSSGRGVTVEHTDTLSTGVQHGPLGAGHVVTNTKGTRVVGSHHAVGGPLGAPGVGAPYGGLVAPGFVGKPGLAGPVHPGVGLHGAPFPVTGAGAVKTSSVQHSTQFQQAGGIGSPLGVPGAGGIGHSVASKTISQQAYGQGAVGSPIYG